MTVAISPMPQKIREIPERWRPGPPPVFPDGKPTDAERALARDLWRALDLESRRWYYRGGCGLLDLTARDLAGLDRRPRASRSGGDK